ESLRAIPWLVPYKSVWTPAIHPTVTPTTQVWGKLYQYPDIEPTPSPDYPITKNPLFIPGKGGYQLTPVKGDRKEVDITLKKVMQEGGLVPITHLTEGKIPTLMQRFQYAQLRHFLTTQGLSQWAPRERTKFEKLCAGVKPPPRQTSLCYRLQQTQAFTQLPYFTRLWSEHINGELGEGDWTNIFRTIFHSHSSVPLQEINYKFIAKWYITPADIHKFAPDSSPLCWRCHSHKGTFQHIWWSCGEVSAFWREVWNTVNLVTEMSIPFNPETLLLLHLKTPLRQFKYSLTFFMLTAAKSTIVHKWKSTSLPTTQDWYTKIEYFHEMEELRWGSLDQYHRYHNIWQPWKYFFWGKLAQGQTHIIPSRPKGDPVDRIGAGAV
ncbi:Hypothetical predicted protein, partial [Pelobates cultripes]